MCWISEVSTFVVSTFPISVGLLLHLTASRYAGKFAHVGLVMQSFCIVTFLVLSCILIDVEVA